MIGESILELHETNATDESIKSYEAQGWFPGTNINAAADNIGFSTGQRYLVRIPDPNGSFQCAIPMRHIRFCG